MEESINIDKLRPLFLSSERTDKDKLRPYIFFVWEYRQRQAETLYFLSGSTDKDKLYRLRQTETFINCWKVWTKTR